MIRYRTRPQARPRPRTLRCKCGDILFLTVVAGLLCPSCTRFAPTSAPAGRKAVRR